MIADWGMILTVFGVASVGIVTMIRVVTGLDLDRFPAPDTDADR